MDAAYARSLKGAQAAQRKVTATQAKLHALEHFFGPDGRQSAVAETAILEEALRYAAGDVLAPEMKKELAKHDLIRAEIKGRMVCTTEEAHGEEQAVGNVDLVGTRRRVRRCWPARPICRSSGGCGGLTLDREQTEAIGAPCSPRATASWR